MKRILVVVGACLLAAAIALIPQFGSAHQTGPTAMTHHGTAGSAAMTHVSGHAGSATQPAIRRLSGTVGPDMTITMSKSKTVAGRYKITINDKSALHNFHLIGPNGVNKATGVSFVGTVTWRVHLVAGTWKFQCDVHPLTMHGTLKVVTG